jgi:3-phenylpropionate/trans-cinnamate dioxygenase ferredoxin reductase subunit|tara:strand:- start:70 stop:1215 length:1146 start_codon:yes stop_codon:yes gene_type:complete
MSEQLVVVGASVATTAFVERLRELGNSEPILVVDDDLDAPYDRPPLSKHYLTAGQQEDIAVDWSDLDVRLLPATATDVDVTEHVLRVRTADEALHDVLYGTLVIATGAVPIRLPVEPPGTTVLRSAADARRLREQTQDGQSVIVIGAGAIGVELASSLTARGSRVVLLDRAQGPLERLLAGHLTHETTQWLEQAGVECHWGVDITRISMNDTWRVELTGEQPLEADVLVSAVGARPAVAWLADSGLLVNGALLVDDSGRVVSESGSPAADVFAIGDVVTRRSADGSLSRTESWAAARQHGAQLAEDFCYAERQRAPLPYFWTEIAERKVQIVGELHPAAPVSLEFENPDRQSALYRIGEDEQTAWIGINAQPRIAKLLMRP